MTRATACAEVNRGQYCLQCSQTRPHYVCYKPLFRLGNTLPTLQPKIGGTASQHVTLSRHHSMQARSVLIAHNPSCE